MKVGGVLLGPDCSLIEFHDWSDAGHPFDPVKEDFMTYVLKREVHDQSTIPLTKYVRKSARAKAHLWHNLGANEHLRQEKKVAGQIIEGSTAYTIANNAAELKKFKKIAGMCAYIGREGIEFYPQELLLFQYVGPGPRAGVVCVENIQVQKSKYKIPQQKVMLETRYLFPFLAKGPSIEVFNYDDPEILVAFPYDEKDPHAPISKAALRNLSPFLLRYYEKYKEQLEQQTAYSDLIRGDGEYYGLARTGPYSFKSCYVAFRDNTKWCATVLTTKKMPWGEEKKFLFQNHAVSICENSDGEEITEEEAFFVAGIFNTEIVEHFINASSDNRSFKIRPPVYVPIFEQRNSHHTKIVRLAREAAAKPDRREALLAELEAEYVSMCDDR